MLWTLTVGVNWITVRNGPGGARGVVKSVSAKKSRLVGQIPHFRNAARIENYVPHTRSKIGLPEEKIATKAGYTEMFEWHP